MAEISNRKAQSLMKQRDKLLREMSELNWMIRGSSFERYSTCSRPNCSCHSGKRHGPRTYVSVRRKGGPRQHYVPKDQETAVEEGIEQYQRLLMIAEQITDINLELMRGGMLKDE
jgi:hypothetical protein